MWAAVGPLGWLQASQHPCQVRSHAFCPCVMGLLLGDAHLMCVCVCVCVCVCRSDFLLWPVSRLGYILIALRLRAPSLSLSLPSAQQTIAQPPVAYLSSTSPHLHHSLHVSTPPKWVPSFPASSRSSRPLVCASEHLALPHRPLARANNRDRKVHHGCC
jgi:hypothetical protein